VQTTIKPDLDVPPEVTSLFDQPAGDLVRQRASWRSYEPRPIVAELRDRLSRFIETHSSVPFGTAIRMQLVAASDQDRVALGGLGTYGFIRDAPGFFVGAAESSPMCLEDFGYAMERLILAATDLGLGTCWLGGSFRQSRFANKIAARHDEHVPAVVAVGHAMQQRGTLDRILRWGAGATQRKPWQERFFHGDFNTPLSPDEAGPYAEALELLRLAPSASNQQPWRLLKDRRVDRYHFFVHRRRKYARNLRLLRLADLPRVDLGIALCHFELGAHQAGLEGNLIVAPGSVSSPAPEGTDYVASWIPEGIGPA
jgi:nitroreductase